MGDVVAQGGRGEHRQGDQGRRVVEQLVRVDAEPPLRPVRKPTSESGALRAATNLIGALVADEAVARCASTVATTATAP
jgi:hypothetical protein